MGFEPGFCAKAIGKAAYTVWIGNFSSLSLAGRLKGQREGGIKNEKKNKNKAKNHWRKGERKQRVGILHLHFKDTHKLYFHTPCGK